MRLQDEYIRRHNLQYKPIYYVNNANLILKLALRPQVVVNIKWEDITRRPGYYVFDYLAPNHNGYLNGNYFISLGDKHYYQYDEYTNFIMRWVKCLTFTPVKFSEVKLAVLEMFLYCFDGWVAENNLEEIAFHVANPYLPETERCSAIDSFLSYDSTVFDIYNSEFRQYECDYANWLVELIECYSELNKEANNGSQNTLYDQRRF